MKNTPTEPEAKIKHIGFMRLSPHPKKKEPKHNINIFF